MDFGKAKEMAADTVFLKSPQSDEIREVEATAEKLSPLLSQGWHKVPAPAGRMTAIQSE